jgi:hypothetical protein
MKIVPRSVLLGILALAAGVSPISAQLDRPGAFYFRLADLHLMQTEVERSAQREQAIARARVESVKPFDLDHDGYLNDREFAAWEHSLRSQVEAHPKFGPLYDRDGDRKLSDAEWAVARQAFVPANWN